MVWFLTNWALWVKVQKKFPKLIDVTSMAPYGSVLGAAFFLYYTNDCLNSPPCDAAEWKNGRTISVHLMLKVCNISCNISTFFHTGPMLALMIFNLDKWVALRQNPQQVRAVMLSIKPKVSLTLPWMRRYRGWGAKVSSPMYQGQR